MANPGPARRVRTLALAAAALLSLAAAPVVTATDAAVTADVADGSDEQPGDDLPPEEDSASYKSCGTPAVTDAGSRIVRVVPAGPRRQDGSLAFVPGVCVHLPPGYDDGTMRYPVVYYLHGGGGSQGAGYNRLRDEAALADPSRAVIWVAPDGAGLAGWFDRFDDNNTSVQNLQYAEQGPAYGRTLNETYVLEWVIPYIDQHFRTIPTREGRALSGISNGGHGAALLAAKRPDLFSVVSVLSGNVAWQSVTMSQELFLDVETGEYSPTYRAGNIPANLAVNLDHVDMIVDIGTTCPAPTVEDPLYCRYDWEFEQLFVQGNRDLQLAIARAGHRADLDYRETEGGHASRWWSEWFRERHLPFLAERLADPVPAGAVPAPSAAPTSFRYRSIDTAFSVWGHDVEVERDVREFLELSVDGESITLTGSGAASVSTPGRYVPGARYRVLGAGADAQDVVADSNGRLTVQVDLGPSNQQEDPRWVGDTGLLARPLGLPVSDLEHPSTTRTLTITHQG